MAPRPTDVRKIAELLVEGADTPEDLAKAVITKLDEIRAERVQWMVVHQFGTEKPWYAGHGPYSTRGQGEKAVARNPAISEATHTALVPVRTAAGLETVLKNVDEIAEAKSQWAVVRQDVADFKSGARKVKQRGWRIP
jgi:hypothetical protein